MDIATTKHEREPLTTEQQIEELRSLLAASVGHQRFVLRPPVQAGLKPSSRTPGAKTAVFADSPVVVVTFCITLPGENLPSVV